MPAFQRCYARITGDLMYATASDDYLSDPRFFEMVVQALKTHPLAAGVFARQRVVWNDTEELVATTGACPADGFVAPEICLESYLLGRLLACGLSSVWRVPYVRAIGGYPADLGPYSELYVNHALPALYGAVFLPVSVGVARIPRDSSSYSEAMDIEEKARVCARLEAMLRRLETAKGLNPEVFLSFRRRTIDESIVERRLNEQSLREMQRLIAAHMTFCRARVLREAWRPVQQAVRDVETLTRRELARVHAVFEEETGVAMPPPIEHRQVHGQILWALYVHLRWIRRRFASGAPFRVAVYGAGGHSRDLLHVWRSLDLPPWALVLVSGHPTVPHFEGVPLRRVSDVEPGEIDLIVLSSQSHEPTMILSCMGRFPSVPRLAIWDSAMSTVPSESARPDEWPQ
jgi:hypothetical protein